MTRVLLFALLALVLLRAVWRLLDGILEGFAGRQAGPGSRVPQRGVQMVRDPVCGTFVVPGRALSVSERGAPVYFCSATCRDKYRAERTA
jgi:YHS domain-containing protein